MLEECSLCGLCKSNCPVFNLSFNEGDGPRGKIILLKKDVLVEEVLNKCSLCNSCKVNCPVDIDLPKEIREARKKLLSEKESEKNKKMIENIRKFGNPFGKVEEGEIPKELYCC